MVRFWLKEHVQRRCAALQHGGGLAKLVSAHWGGLGQRADRQCADDVCADDQIEDGQCADDQAGGGGVAPGRARAKVMCVRRTRRQIFFA